MKTGTGVKPMTVRVIMRTMVCAVLASCALHFSGCTSEPPGEIRKKLDTVAENDFREIIADLPAKSRADSAYFRIAEYKDFPKGQYRVKAVIDYYYLRNVRVKRSLKYRYVKSVGKWERYANDYVYY
jgi:hypothetical protein